MPARADDSRATIRHIREGVDDPATYGIVPASPLLTSTIITTESLKGNSGIKESEVSKPNRLPGPRRETSLDGGGDVNIEGLFCPELDGFFEDALCDEFSDPFAVASASISASSVDNSLNDGSGPGTLFANIPVGVWIDVGGFTAPAAGNNARAYVLSKPTAVKLILAYVVLTTKVAGDPVTIDGRFVRDGVKLMTRTFERDRPEFGANRYQAYRGQYCNGMELTLNFEEIVKGKFTYLGRGPDAPSAASVGTGAPVAGTPFVNVVDVSNNMRMFRTGGALDGNIKQLTITLGNGGELVKLAQTKYPDGVTMGVASLTGTLEGYLVDGSGRQLKAFNRTPESIHFEVVDDVGKCYVFTIWRLLYNEKGDAAKSKRTGPAMLTLPWAAEEDPTIGHWFQICAFD